MNKNIVSYTEDRVIITKANVVTTKANDADYVYDEAHRINDELDASYAAMLVELEALARARFGGSSTLWEYEEAYDLNK